MRSWVRQFLRWFSLFVTMLFVLISCSTGDNPISVNPTQDPGGSISTEIQSISLMNAQSTFEVSYSIRSQWQDGFVADVTIENFGDPIDGWTLSWIFPSDQIRITNLWNGKLTQNGANVSVKDAGWNAPIPTNGQVNFGFQASYRGTDVIPSAFSLNGESLSKPTPIPLPSACEVDYQIRSEWEQGFVADLTLQNLGAPVTDWELSWAFPVDGVQITNLWNGRVNQTGREVRVTNLDWNATIATDGEVDLGFQAAYTGGGVTPTEFRLNGLICNGLPASPSPSSNPDGSPQPSSTPIVEIPTNAVIIANASEVDGTPLQIGQNLAINAVAGDLEGHNISEKIKWTDQEGTVLGTGPVLVYTGRAVKAETLTASIDDQSARVFFTVSDESVKVAPHVKVLPDEAEANIVTLDWETGTLELIDNDVLPPIYEGDVIVGANTEVPPMKVLKLVQEDNVLKLEIELALPKDVIEKGSVHVERDFGAEANAGDGVNLLALDIGNNFSFPIQIPLYSQATGNRGLEFEEDTKWGGFVDAGVSTNAGIDLSLVGEVSYNPRVVIDVEFDKERDPFSGLRLLHIERTGQMSAKAALVLNGYWELTQDLEFGLYKGKVVVKFAAGPVPVWIKFVPEASIELANYLRLSVQGEWGVKYEGGELNETIHYENGAWWRERGVGEGQVLPISSANIDFTGSSELAFHPEIGAYLYSVAGLKTGLRFYVRGQTGSNFQVLIDQPENGDSYGPGDPIKLNAAVSGGHKIDLFAGIRWTLGSTEPSHYCINDAFSDFSSSPCTENCVSLVTIPNTNIPLPSPQQNQLIPGFTELFIKLKTKPPIVGGSYTEVRTTTRGGEVHHMPAACITRFTPLLGNRSTTVLAPDRTSSILMEKEDHETTRSFKRRGPPPRETYLNDCSKEKFLAAMEDDIKVDVTNNSNIAANKKAIYQDEFVNAMREYADSLTKADVCPTLETLKSLGLS